MLDHLKSFCAALATRGPVRLRVEVNAEAWRTLRAEFHRPYKHEPNAGFTLYLEGGAGTVEFVPEKVGPLTGLTRAECWDLLANGGPDDPRTKRLHEHLMSQPPTER